VPSITRELDATRTARWYVRAHDCDSWIKREQCFGALTVILDDHRASARPGERPSQPPVQVPGLLDEVARRLYFRSREPVYKRWRSRPDGQRAARWAGPDFAITPAAAFIHEAKIVGFWPYRAGVLEVAGAFSMTDVEVLTAYLRALAAWACDHLTLAALVPSGPPACVAEDMEVFAAGDAARASRLAGASRAVVQTVLDDPSMTPLGAFNMVRGEVVELYREPVRIADRVHYSVAELSDRLMREADPAALVDQEQCRLLLASLDELRLLLTSEAVAPSGGAG
jgi:hypothetical protein